MNQFSACAFRSVHLFSRHHLTVILTAGIKVLPTLDLHPPGSKSPSGTLLGRHAWRWVGGLSGHKLLDLAVALHCYSVPLKLVLFGGADGFACVAEMGA